jgi:hypothetical protein
MQLSYPEEEKRIATLQKPTSGRGYLETKGQVVLRHQHGFIPVPMKTSGWKMCWRASALGRTLLMKKGQQMDIEV